MTTINHILAIWSVLATLLLIALLVAIELTPLLRYRLGRIASLWALLILGASVVLGAVTAAH